MLPNRTPISVYPHSSHSYDTQYFGTVTANSLDDLRMINEERSPSTAHRGVVRAKKKKNSKYHMALPISFHWAEGYCWFLPGRLRNVTSQGRRSSDYQLTIFTIIPWTMCQVLIMIHSSLNQPWLSPSLAMAIPFPNYGTPFPNHSSAPS